MAKDKKPTGKHSKSKYKQEARKYKRAFEELRDKFQQLARHNRILCGYVEIMETPRKLYESCEAEMYILVDQARQHLDDMSRWMLQISEKFPDQISEMERHTKHAITAMKECIRLAEESKPKVEAGSAIIQRIEDQKEEEIGELAPEPTQEKERKNGFSGNVS